MPVTTVSQDAGPARYHANVTPSNSIDFSVPTRGLRVGGAGNVSVVVGGVTLVYTCTAGEVLPLCADRVNATGTTATNITAWW